jgi:hypothetical protein
VRSACVNLPHVGFQDLNVVTMTSALLRVKILCSSETACSFRETRRLSLPGRRASQARNTAEAGGKLEFGKYYVI